MTGRTARAVRFAIAGALIGASSLAGLYAARARLVIGFDNDPPKLLRGVYPAERDAGSELTFAWTGADMSLRVPNLDRRIPWVLDLRVRGARPAPADNPRLVFYVDGVQIDTKQSETAFENLSVTIPAASRRVAVISMQSSATLTPGPHDTRTLGVMLDWMALSPRGIPLAPAGALTGAAIVGAAFGAAIALLGVPLVPGCVALLMVASLSALLIARGFGPYTGYPFDAAKAAAGVAGAMALGAWLVPRLTRDKAGAVAISGGAVLLKMLVLLHPDMPVGDAMFHAHRFQGVLAGNIYFTSIAPGGYLFPYPPGFYLFAAPLAPLVTRGAADMTLLRMVSITVDGLVALSLYAAVVRTWNNRVAALATVAIYHLIPLDFRVFSVGNLTNAFAQSVSVGALALLAAADLRLERTRWVALLTFVLAVAFMSHTSTFPLCFSAAVLTALLFWWKGGLPLRSPGTAVMIAAAIALVLSAGLYYAHFGETYRSEFARIGRETASAAPDAGGRGIPGRLASVPYYLVSYFGVPALALAAAGVVALARRPRGDRLALVTAAWALACAVFMVIGILTPVDMRYYLASIPALAIAGGAGVSMLWNGGPASRTAAALLAASLTWAGLGTWLSTIQH